MSRLKKLGPTNLDQGTCPNNRPKPEKSEPTFLHLYCPILAWFIWAVTFELNVAQLQVIWVKVILIKIFIQNLESAKISKMDKIGEIWYEKGRKCIL